MSDGTITELALYRLHHGRVPDPIDLEAERRRLESDGEEWGERAGDRWVPPPLLSARTVGLLLVLGGGLTAMVTLAVIVVLSVAR